MHLGLWVPGSTFTPCPLSARTPHPAPSSGHRKRRPSQAGASRTNAMPPQPARKGRVSTAVSCGPHPARQGAQTVRPLPPAPRGPESGPAGTLATPGQALSTGGFQRSLVFQPPRDNDRTGTPPGSSPLFPACVPHEATSAGHSLAHTGSSKRAEGIEGQSMRSATQGA